MTESGVDPRSERISHRGRYSLLFLTALLIGFTMGCGAYNLMAQRAMLRDVERYPRDPMSGVVKGTEAITLEGEGPDAALLVHGFVGSRIDFNDLGEELQREGYTVRLMRVPGHGTYAVEHAATSSDTMLEAVREEYLALKRDYERVVLIGFSMGGSLSAILATEEDVDRLVLIAPYFGVTHRWYYPGTVKGLNNVFGTFIPYVMKNDFFTCVNRKEAKEKLYCYHVLSTQSAKTLIKLGERTRDPELLARIQCPVLVLHSRGDRAASPSRSEKGYAAIGAPDKRIVWYEDSNHHLLWDYDREAAKAEILAFVRGAG